MSKPKMNRQRLAIDSRCQYKTNWKLFTTRVFCQALDTASRKESQVELLPTKIRAAENLLRMSFKARARVAGSNDGTKQYGKDQSKRHPCCFVDS